MDTAILQLVYNSVSARGSITQVERELLNRWMDQNFSTRFQEETSLSELLTVMERMVSSLSGGSKCGPRLSEEFFGRDR